MSYNYFKKEIYEIEINDRQYNELKETAILLLKELKAAGEEHKLFNIKENNNTFTFELWGLQFEILAEIPLEKGKTKFTTGQLNNYLIKEDKTKELIYSCPFDCNGVTSESFLRGEFEDFYLKDFLETLYKYIWANEVKFLLVINEEEINN